VSCATLRRELNYLNKSGFLDVDKILYTMPGLHEKPGELERQLIRQIDNAGRYSRKLIVVYGSKCYINLNSVSADIEDIDRLIKTQGDNIRRIDAKNCIDMLMDTNERKKVGRGQRIYWLSPGWLEYWQKIFEGWDIGKTNETFPQNDKAILLDGIGFFDKYSQRYPERVLAFSDWMGLSIEPYKISLDRLKNLVLGARF